MSLNVAEQDQQYLQLLTIFHYVVSGIAALLGCFPILHLGLGVSMLFTSLFRGTAGIIEPTEIVFFSLFGLLFTLIPLLIILFFWGLAVATAVSGHFIHTRQRRIFSIVVAAINCVMFPFGTVLGVLTIIMLVRPSVIMLYERETAVVVHEEE